MDIKTACSTKDSARDVAKEIAEKLEGFETRQLIYFASSRHEPAAISAAMQETFPGCQVFGCSSSGEIASGKMLKNSVVAMAFSSNSITDTKIEVVEDVKNMESVQKAFDAFESHYQTPVATMDPGEYVGIILVDGLSIAEEALIEKIGDMTNVIFVGGSAGDDLKFEATHVYANGKSYANAAVLALMKPAKPFTFIKTQSFNDLGKVLEITGADEETRVVTTINNQPAAKAYAEAVGSSLEDAPKHFRRNPLGLIIEDEPYVRSPQQILADGSMKFYCGVSEGMELSLLESTNIIENTRASIETAREELGGISGIINFNCILRTLELYEKKLDSPYGELFSSIPTIGFSTYGEQYIGHLTQTATMLVFK
jgi:hypothetical protein